MNTPLYRARDIKTDDLVYGDLAYVDTTNFKNRNIKCYILKHQAHGGMLYIGSRHWVKEDTIQRFTGLYDKNKEPIYEGDIVITKYGRGCKVVWFNSPSYCGWDLTPFKYMDLQKPDKFDLWEPNNLEVIINLESNLNIK